MLKMRLQRIGRKNNPSYRVIVTDSRNAAKRGTNVDHIGSYEPKAGNFQIDGEKAKYWISKGVQASDTVYNFLVTQKIIEGKKKNALSRKSPIIDEAKIKSEAEAKAAKEAKEKAEAEAKVAAEKATEAEAKEKAEQEAQAPVADKVNDEVRERHDQDDLVGQEVVAEAPVTEEVPAVAEETPATEEAVKEEEKVGA